MSADKPTVEEIYESATPDEKAWLDTMFSEIEMEPIKLLEWHPMLTKIRLTNEFQDTERNVKRTFHVEIERLEGSKPWTYFVSAYEDDPPDDAPDDPLPTNVRFLGDPESAYNIATSYVTAILNDNMVGFREWIEEQLATDEDAA